MARIAQNMFYQWGHQKPFCMELFPFSHASTILNRFFTYSNRRCVSFQPYRKAEGHKLELVMGKHTKKHIRPPVVPLHPTMDNEKNMEMFTTYKDLRLRWRTTSRRSRKRMNIARKWPVQHTSQPSRRSTCCFIFHKNMGVSNTFPETPSIGTKLDTSNCFCIFKSSIMNQHKVTVGDLVQTEKLHRREAGENIEFGTVLMVGSKDWTIIGKPTVPYALVRATIEQQTLAGEQISFKYKKHRRNSRFLRIRHWVTMIRINEIVVDTAIKAELPEVKPLRLLDLWANRWLNAEEKEGIQYKEDGESVIVADIYDGSEHQPGSYHRRGLSNCYRWYPDPYATHWQM